MTRNWDIENRIQKVLTYVHYNIGEKHSLEKLADIGSISPYHFHRLVRKYMNEPLGAYIKRYRMETAYRFITTTNKSITEIAYKMGYDTISSFSKAFSLHFKFSPKDLRANKDHLKSCTNFNIRNIGKYISTSHSISETPIITEQSEYQIAYRPVIGIGQGQMLKAWDKLQKFIKNNNMDELYLDHLGIFYNSPHTTELNKIRHEACIRIENDLPRDENLFFRTIPQSKTAIFRHKGPYYNICKSMEYIIHKWLPQSKESLSELPITHKYINNPETTPSQDLLIDIHIPLE
ncbi:MAG: GyrI-like domain-containing protein [Hyphomicrobiales bacterium]